MCNKNIFVAWPQGKNTPVTYFCEILLQRVVRLKCDSSTSAMDTTFFIPWLIIEGFILW